jgi:CubicO group peptidase (beta-lactamase class C family)
MKWLFTLFTILLFFNLSDAQELSKQKKDSLDLFFKSLERNDKFMGQVGVFKNGQMIYYYSLGFTNIDANLKAGKESGYRIGSISKTFTAALVLKAVEEGKISLDQTIETFFPTIKNAKKVTIGQLLTHHSGIHNFTGEQDFFKWRTNPKSDSEMISIISAGGSDFEPGQKAAYSNSNYVLLSYILEKIYNKKYAAILQKKIIKPLGLQYTQFGDKSLPENKKTYSYTYEVDWKKEGMTDESIPMGAGGILSSANDLSVFINGLFDGKLISNGSLNIMLEQKDGYGMGIFKKNIVEREAYTHDGVIDGFNSIFYYFPEQKLTYVLLSNGKSYNLANINGLVLKAVLDQPFEIPQINPYKVTAQDLVPYLGVYTNPDNPLIITISKNGNRLLAKPKGQKTYTMDAIDKDKFGHNESGVTLEFNSADQTMKMRQGKQILNFSKSKD